MKEYSFNWHPLTWVSHMLDVELYGLNPGLHHLTNVIFHILNSILLFLILEKMTGARWRSAAVAALFALHPLHVESVAWIAERKDVLSTFFWMLTMASYLLYVHSRTLSRYLVVVFFYILGLLSKPMLVTLPFILLIMDLWPLNRLELIQTGDNGNNNFKAMWESSGRWSRLRSLILEKIPLIILATISCGITIHAQRSWGAVGSLEGLPIGTRIANAIISYVAYLWKMLWPLNLAAFYPYPDAFPPFEVISCLLILLSITGLILFFAKSFPYLMVGWLWYLGTLIPVIGIMQVGSQSMADRYTYIPLIGIFLSLVWGLWELFCRLRHGKAAFGVVSVTALVLFTVITQVQVGFWKNSETLFRHAIKVTKNNYMAHNNLGVVLLDKGDVEGAIREYQEALRMKPMFYLAHFNLGLAYTKKGEASRAIEYYVKGLQINPDYTKVHNDLGALFMMAGQTDEAIKQYDESLRLDPYQPAVYNNLGNTYIHKADLNKAAECFKKAVQINPDYTMALYGLVLIYSTRQEYPKALEMLQKIRRLQPNKPEVSYNIACIYAKQKMADESIDWLKQSVGKGFHDWDLLKNDPDLANIRGTAFMKNLIKNH
jgi:Flp pilus assembly protein TadD